MQVLLNKSLPSLAHYITENSRENLAVYAGQSRLSKYACPCCSYILLRHIDLAGIYWRCSHCYQEMPVYQSLLNDRNDKLAQNL